MVNAGSSTRTNCRCGFDGTGAHPCHFAGYTCKAAASHRFYNARPVALAGMNLKFGVQDTWACDAHWEEFTREAREKGYALQ